MESTLPSNLLRILGQANQAAAQPTLTALLGASLQLLAKTAQARGGLLFLSSGDSPEIICLSSWGMTGVEQVDGKRIQVVPGQAREALDQRAPRFISDLATASDWHTSLGEVARSNVLWLPLCHAHGIVGAVQLLDCHNPDIPLLQLVAQRMATEIDKASRLEAARQHVERLDALLTIFQQIGSTLDRDQLLSMMIDYAREVIDAEACSLFLVDEATHENVLHLASNVGAQFSRGDVRVPSGQGIIGQVVDTGNSLLVSDVSRDERHYRQSDINSGFVTRAILAVPLRTHTLVLGSNRGILSTRVIGGLEALNKQKGTFDSDDALLLGRLASQAATVLQIADLYSEVNELFLDVIKALATSIDAKDPYTEGHSQRVADFSVAIGRQMGLDGETLHQLRIGSLLHDIGKIGIPDRILVKPGRLNDAEYQIMRQHPTIGMNILGQVRRLHAELPALAEHHERLDGSGYPNGLQGEQISSMGRIVAVADVFDAMTSDRPYRKSMDAAEVMDYLYQQAGVHYDRHCLGALHQGLMSGEVQTQQMRAVG